MLCFAVIFLHWFCQKVPKQTPSSFLHFFVPQKNQIFLRNKKSDKLPPILPKWKLRNVRTLFKTGTMKASNPKPWPVTSQLQHVFLQHLHKILFCFNYVKKEKGLHEIISPLWDNTCTAANRACAYFLFFCFGRRNKETKPLEFCSVLDNRITFSFYQLQQNMEWN